MKPKSCKTCIFHDHECEYDWKSDSDNFVEICKNPKYNTEDGLNEDRAFFQDKVTGNWFRYSPLKPCEFYSYNTSLT